MSEKAKLGITRSGAHMLEKAAKDLARNPLGIIALFIVLVYGIAALAMSLTSSLTAEERVPLVWFLVGFPVLVLGAFCWLVSQHHQKLYAPSDYKSDEGFLTAAQTRSRHIADLQSQQEDLKLRVREALEKSAAASPVVETIIKDVQTEIENATSITIDARDFLGPNSEPIVFPIGAFETLDALTNEVYFRLERHVRPFEYGYTWILRNTETGEVVKTSRMITGTPAGKPLADNRALQEVGIKAGATLRVERPN